MSKMKKLATDIEELFALLVKLVNDVHDIAEYVRRKQDLENRTIQKTIKKDEKWSRLR
jgi:outer membrane murein-binding lipoprotein Lpp